MSKYSSLDTVYAKIDNMNEGEDPNTPITSGNNPPADNSDGMFSIRHDDEPEEDELEQEQDDTVVDEEEEVTTDDGYEEEVADTDSAPEPNLDNDAEPRDIFGSNEPVSEPAPAPTPAPEAIASAPANNMNTQNKPERANYSQRRSSGRRDFSGNNTPQTPDFFNNAMAANTAAVAMNNERKSGNKKRIILVSIGMVALIGLFAAFMIFFTGRVSLKDTYLGFNRFANYLLYGKTDSEIGLSGEYNEEETYYVSSMLNVKEGEEDTLSEIIKTADEQFDKFSELVKKTNASGDLKNKLVDYNNSARGWKIFIDFSKDSDELVKRYEERGKGNAISYARGLYSSMKDDEQLKEISEMMTEMRLAQVEYIDAIEIEGCKVSELSRECENRVFEIIKNNDQYAVMNSKYNSAREKAGARMVEALKKSWDISRELMENSR